MDPEHLALSMLGLLAGSANDPAELSSEWKVLIPIARGNLVLVRIEEHLRGAGVSPPAGLASAASEERGRILRTLSAAADLRDICDASSIPYVMPKIATHYPDMGHDIDLLVADTSRGIDRLLELQLGAIQTDAGLFGRVAGKTAYDVPEWPSPVEIHHGLMGHAGEIEWYATELVARRRVIDLGGVQVAVPSPEDSLIVQVVQRIYDHLSIRLSDVIATRDVLAKDLDWDRVARTAYRLGIQSGVRAYVGAVRALLRQATGIDQPAGVGWLMSDEVAGPVFDGKTYRLPMARMLQVHAGRLAASLRRRDLRATMRIVSGPALAGAALVRRAAMRTS